MHQLIIVYAKISCIPYTLLSHWLGLLICTVVYQMRATLLYASCICNDCFCLDILIGPVIRENSIQVIEPSSSTIDSELTPQKRSFRLILLIHYLSRIIAGNINYSYQHCACDHHHRSNFIEK